MENKFKVCTICKDEKDINDFNKKSTSKDGRQNVCRGCNSKSNKAHYRRNKKKIKARSAARRDAQKLIIKEYIWSHLKNHGCVDCGETDPVVLEFDHQRDKKYSISEMITAALSLNTLAKEIEKCQIRCSNCHQRKTANEFGWWRLKGN